MNRMSLNVIAVFTVAMAVAGCDSSPAAAADETASAPSSEEATGDCPGAEDDALCTSTVAQAPEPLELTAEGVRFEPPVEVDRVPNEAWYCNMGTTHFAALEQGDGSCPVCGMFLVQKSEPSEEAESQPTSDHTGHEH